MDNFIVSARKYRPASFDTVIGQNSITLTLKNAIRQNQLAQAFLFCGPRGVGKTTCARILAKTINCQNITASTEPCNACESCLNFNTTASFNIYELDAASNNSVDDIRNLVDQVRIPPQTGKYKVYIIDEVHMLSTSAFNAFLKTLEEPPAYAKFILATTEKHKIIPTILSRCQIFDFKRITVENIILQLKYVALSEHVNIDDDSLHIIAVKADGAMRDALSIFDQIVSFSGAEVTYSKVIENLNVLDYDYYFRLTANLLEGNITSSLLLIDQVIDRGFDGQHFMMGLGSHLRNLLVCKDPATIKLLDAGESMKARYLDQVGKCSVPFLLKSLEVINQFDLNYRISNNKRLHLEILLMQLCGINARQQAGAGVPDDSQKKTLDPSTDKAAPSPSPAVNDILKIQPPPPRVTNPLGRGSVSIKEITQNNKPKEEDDQNGTHGIAEEDLPASEFSQERLEASWFEFADIQGKSSTHLFTTLTKHKPQLKENFEIEFTIDNKVQETDLNALKKDLLGFLKKSLDNYLIDLNLLVAAGHKDIKPYTPIDKFKKMAEQNPAIIQLKDQFDLELDV
jgi:DNA polymerase III subunit gamma/tau